MHFIVKGKQVFASTGGKPFDKAKPVVIFLHGSALDHTFWGLHSRFFAFRNYAVLVPDLPGHTHSEGPALTSIEAIGDWLNDVAEVLDIDNISVVAHSQPVVAIAMMVGWGFAPAGHLHQGPIPGNSMVAGGRKVMRRNVPDELATDLRDCDAYMNGKVAAAKITCPIQVIIAGQDRMAPRKATTELVEYLGDAEVHVIPESGHMVPQEAPNKCRQLLKTFIFANNPAT